MGHNPRHSHPYKASGRSGWRSSFADHLWFFRTADRRAAAVVTQPYGQWTASHPEIQAYCEQRGLQAREPNFPSWWKPRVTKLIVFLPAD